jgi:hypothetical protein
MNEYHHISSASVRSVGTRRSAPFRTTALASSPGVGMHDRRHLRFLYPPWHSCRMLSGTMWVASRVVLLSIALSVTSCTAECPVASRYTVQLLESDLLLDGSTADLSSALNLLPETATGVAWRAAVSDSSSVTPGFGSVLMGSGTFGELGLGLPFPLVTGQTVQITSDPNSRPALDFQFTSSVSAATAWVGTCTFTGKNCQLQTSQTVEGTVVVTRSMPLVLQVDLRFFDAAHADTPAVTVSGPLSFHIKSPEVYCHASDG